MVPVVLLSAKCLLHFILDLLEAYRIAILFQGVCKNIDSCQVNTEKF
jgi:hypothetical protein